MKVVDDDFLIFFVISICVGYVLYFGTAAYWHWTYYRGRKNSSEIWKCQPKKWLSGYLEIQAVMLGSLNILINSIVSALLFCHVNNGGYTTLYYQVMGRGLLWFIFQWPVILLYQDYTSYWIHRLYHTSFLYKKFHKLHHRFKEPTAVTAAALHPVESLTLLFNMSAPIFLFPVHWFPFYSSIIYYYYHVLVSHSGVNIRSFWWQPWQVDAIFHDSHHVDGRFNFGVNMSYWDIIHGTYRKKSNFNNVDVAPDNAISVENLDIRKKKLGYY